MADEDVKPLSPADEPENADLDEDEDEDEGTEEATD